MFDMIDRLTVSLKPDSLDLFSSIRRVELPCRQVNQEMAIDKSSSRRNPFLWKSDFGDVMEASKYASK